MSDSQSYSSEQVQSSLQENTEKTVANNVDEIDAEPPLMPLRYDGKNVAATREKKQSVRRQLPKWIVDADIIPDDIIEQSRYCELLMFHRCKV